MTATIETAWAKINLALHVTGQRDDGYHRIESLVTFADFGDRLTFSAAPADSLPISGAFAETVPAGGDNLVVRARDYLRRLAGNAGHGTGPVRIALEKTLPVAAGIGGGSADAAACLRGLMRLWDLPAKLLDDARLATELGADVPMCLVSAPLVARGIGEELSVVTWLPRLPVVVVNPMIPVSTPEVFARLDHKDNGPLALQPPDGSMDDLVRLLRGLRNDLEKPAAGQVPVIGEVMAALDARGPRLRRMSGSGATFFALFDSPDAARLAGRAINDQYPHWWVRSGLTRTVI
jgi:4-diphosphocytidyl-2-C-methyl-D-erythritol kinase